MASNEAGRGVQWTVIDSENDQAWGPYDSAEEAKADIILMANRNGWREVIEAGDFPFDNTGLHLVQMQSKTGDAAYDSTVAKAILGVEPTNVDGKTEAETIEMAEAEISMAQYRALHERIEDYTRWCIAEGFLARNAIAGPNGVNGPVDWEDFLFEHVEAYLDGVNEHEDRNAVQQIIQPDLDD